MTSIPLSYILHLSVYLCVYVCNCLVDFLVGILLIYWPYKSRCVCV